MQLAGLDFLHDEHQSVANISFVDIVYIIYVLFLVEISWNKCSAYWKKMKTNNYGRLHADKELQGAMTQKVYGKPLPKMNYRAT